MLLRATMGIRVNDTQCGYKIMRADYARDAFEKISITNTFFDVALLDIVWNVGIWIIPIEMFLASLDKSRI
jgi:hypothetical protein